MKIKNQLTSLFLILIAVLFFNQPANSIEPEIRKINPPNLSKDHLGKHILCYRPMRQGTPAMFIEKESNGKIIAHNYGHGGSGWTLGPGSAHYVINLLEKEYSSELKKNTPIAIVGAGAIGLFSALDLSERGYTNVTVIAKSFDDLTSHNAGGLLAPVSMDNAPDMQAIIDEIGIDAYKFYKNIALKKNKAIHNGAVIVPTYFENREDSGLEPYVGKVMSPAKDVVLDFQNGTTRKMVAYDDGIFLDTSSLMQSLNSYLKNKVKFEKKEIKNFLEISQKFIINCTGMGAKALVHDDKMVSVQGHLIMLKDQNPKDLEHMILVYFKEGKTKSGFKVKRSFYMFPKKLPNTATRDVGVIGGTFIEGADANSPNTEEFDIMLQGAKSFYGIQ